MAGVALETNQIPWESLLLMDEHTCGADLHSSLRRSLIPAPLRIGSPSTSPSQYQSPSPPISPAPTLLVSVQTPLHTRSMSGKLSLHEYRRKLSHPDAQDGTTTVPRRMLKRKPKTTNLNNRQGNTIPLSPPATPPASASPFEPSRPVSPILELDHLTFSSGYNNASNTATSCEVSPIDGTFLDFERATPQSKLTQNHLFEAPAGNKSQHRTLVSKSDQYFSYVYLSLSPVLIYSQLPSISLTMTRQSTLRDSIRQIPTRFTAHTKSASESALPRTLRHKGVSFEILTPRRHTGSSLSPTLAETGSPKKAEMPTPSPLDMDIEIPKPAKSPPPRLRRRSASLGPERRCTPSRALFEDLPTAYSSITSGSSSKNRPANPTAYSDEHLPQVPDETTAHHDQFMVSDIEPSSSQEIQIDHPDSEISQPTPEQPAVEETYAASEAVDGVVDEAIHPSNSQRKSNKLVKRRLYGTNDPLSPGCPRLRPIISTFLNRRQPNLHGARGRIEKPKIINDIINRSNNSRPGSALDEIEDHVQATSTLTLPQPNCLHHHFSTGHQEITTSDESHEIVPQSNHDDSPAARSSPFSFTDSKRLEEWKSFILTGTTDQVSSENLPKSMQRTSIFGPNFSRPMSSRARHRKADHRAEYRPQTSDAASPFKTCHMDLPRLSTSSLPYHGDNQGQQGISSVLLRSPDQEFSLSRAERMTGSESYYEDLGPGSSQSSSSNRLSMHTSSSMALRTPQRPKSAAPCEPKDKSKSYHPFFHAHLGSPRPNKKQEQSISTLAKHKGKQSISSVLDGDSDIEPDEAGSEKDWETVTESQMFGSRSRIPVPNLESGSSLANYSSAGTLANRSLMDISSQSHQGSREMRFPFRDRSPRFRRPSWLHTTRQRRFPEISAPSFPRHLYSMSEYPRDPEMLYSTAPPLMASTAQQPAPRAASNSQYHHPSPLRDTHPNPFQSTPPSLNEIHPSERHAKSGRDSKSGFVSAIRSSKLTFQDDNDSNINNINNNSDNPFNSGHHGSGPIRSLRPLPARASMEASAWWTKPAFSSMKSQHSFHSAPFSSTIRGVRDATSLHSRNVSSSSHSHSHPHPHPHHHHHHHPTSSPATHEITTTDLFDSQNPVPVTPSSASQTAQPQTPSLGPRASCTTEEDIELEPLTRVCHRSTPARSRVSSLSSLVSGATSTSRNTPGSLYLSIRAARDKARNYRHHRHNRTLTNNSTSTTGERLLSVRPDTRASSRGEYRRDINSNMDEHDHPAERERVSSPRSILAMSPPAMRSSRPPTRIQSASTARKLRSPNPDDLLRERLDRIETASVVLSNHSPSLHESCVRSPWTTCQPAKQFTVNGASSFFATIDEETGSVPDAYCSTYGRHVFPEPPRLTPQPRRQYQNQNVDALGSAEQAGVHGGTNLSAQRRIGRQLIMIFSLLVPFGWFVVAYIGFEGKLADELIRWRSNGAITEFHVKDKYWASQFAVSYGVFTLIALVVVLAICLTAL
ncbi:uncharacterized protein ARB_07532 [Trichophyton benhamiae CBS 112371]|uniref:Uncharacterized protein n=1 Tax=Arthroderma benhamiae (strain ATCC MYA-4681 / CBS 112371) TaxID=663331 RepID=D4ATG8_ARTBC|nr:uncharacterized protein ARB_07532 [Trichophyton benhamiae CBS 112371]EFE33587.1 hypothetical protein ARB_07532 [Trichophyton benhamiae CBS 112371]